MNVRPIDANALKENGYYLVRVTREQTDLGRVTTRQEVSLDEVPTLDYEPVRHSKWKYYHKQNKAVCLACSFERDLDADFGRAISCPNCGALMNGKGNT